MPLRAEVRNGRQAIGEREAAVEKLEHAIEELGESPEHLAEGDLLVAAAAEENDRLHVAASLYTAMDGACRHAWVEAVESH